MRKPVLGIGMLGCLLGSSFATLPVLPRQSLEQRRSAEDLDGKPVDLRKVSDGHPVVLLFVRTDCPISNRYAPKIAKLREEFQGKARLWLVYPDAEESASRIRTHLREYHFGIPALRDVDHALVTYAHATITPEAAVFDPAGRLIYHGRIDNWYEDFGRSRPVATTNELRDAIRAALEGKPASPDHANAVGCYITDLK